MIFTDRTIIVQKGTSSINDTIILYRGDKEVEIRFTLNEGSPFKFGSGASPNIIEKTEAAYGQLVIKTPNNLPVIFSEVAPTNEGKIIFKITGEMINEITEIGNYSFQIRLFDESMNSRATLPEVVDGIEIREPIASEDVSTTNEVNIATVGYALTTAGVSEDAFNAEGNYNKTTWATGDRITASKLNKIEAGIDGVNKKVASGGTGGGEVDLSGYVTKEIGNASQITFADGQTFQAKLDAGTLKGEKGEPGEPGSNSIDDATASATTTYSSNKIENIKENLSSQIKERATQSELAVERARIDSFTKLTEGSTTGDAELIDARLGIDGITYNNVGSAIRGQLSVANKEINDMRNILTEIKIDNFDIIEKNKAYSQAVPSGAEQIDFNSYIKNVNYGDIYFISTTTLSSTDFGVAFLYDASGNIIKVAGKNTDASSKTYEDYEVIIPYGVVKMIVVSHNNYSANIKIKKAEFLSNYKYGNICSVVNDLAPFKDKLYVNKSESISTDIEMAKVYSLAFKEGATLSDIFCTYYRNVQEGEIYNVKMTTLGNKDYAAVLLYNGNTFVDYVDKNDSDTARTINTTFTIPRGVNLIRMSTTTDKSFTLSKITKEVPNFTDIVNTVNNIADSTVSPNFSYRIDDTGIDVIFKCGNKDFRIRLAKKGGNNLFDFYKFGEIENNSDLPSLEFDSVTNLGISGTDWHSPFTVSAINNIDGDNKNSNGQYNYHFTGGNHQYNNQGSGSTATARLTDLKYYVNGKEVTSGTGYGNILEIRWTNMVQGYNTTKSDGTGREILQENHTLIFDGVDWKTSNELIALEDIRMERCYGIQMDLIEIFKNTIQYIGGSNRQIFNASVQSDCGTGKATKLIATGTSYVASMEIDTSYDVGSFTEVPSPYLFTADYGKSYFNLFSGNMSNGDRYYYRGIYKFYSL